MSRFLCFNSAVRVRGTRVSECVCDLSVLQSKSMPVVKHVLLAALIEV